MAYKRTVNDEFKGKGFIDGDRKVFISTEKKDAGVEYSLDDVFGTVAGEGEEIQFSVKRSSVDESTEPISEVEGE